METKVVNVDLSNIDVAKVRQAAELIDQGGLVAFPTETVYGIACRVESQSLAKLDNLKGRNPDKHYTLHIADKTDAAKYLPTIGLRAKKLITNTWPGPTTIVFEVDSPAIEELPVMLENTALKCLYKNNSIGIRCPDHPVATLLLSSTKNAVVAPSANLTGQPPAVDGKQVLARFSGQIEMLLDAGPCKYGKSSTVAKISKQGLAILRKGVYSQAELEEKSEVKFLFVCTGNTCRSPMAEGLFRKYLAEKLQCNVDQVGKMGYKTYSAGVMEMAGLPASPESITACADRGVDIRVHRSTTLSQQLIEKSDFIFAMARGHCEHVASVSPEAAGKCVRIVEGEDICDPIGQSQQVYDRCADLIEEAVKKRVGELIL